MTAYLSNHQYKKMKWSVVFTAMFLVTSCASSYGAGDYSASEVGISTKVREGVVLEVRSVTIKPDQSYTGMATGAIIGGIAGNQVGGGDDERAIGAVIGAVLGGAIGNQVDKNSNTREGFAYIIEFDNGQIQEIVQGADINIAPGTPVYISFGHDRTRITPRYNGSSAYK